MRDLHYLLNTYNDTESFIYEEELKLLNQGLVIQIPFSHYKDNIFHKNFFQLSDYHYRINTNPLAGVDINFLRRNHALKLHMFVEDIFLMELYIGSKKIFEKKLILFTLDDLNFPELSLADKLLWWKKDFLSFKITLIKKSDVRIAIEKRECIFNSYNYLEKLLNDSKLEFLSLKKNNLNYFERASKSRLGLVDYSRTLEENINFIQTMNIVEIRNIWANLWNNGILDSIDTNEVFLEKCEKNCNPIVNLLTIQYDFIKSFNQIEVETDSFLIKTINLFRLLLNS